MHQSGNDIWYLLQISNYHSIFNFLNNKARSNKQNSDFTCTGTFTVLIKLLRRPILESTATCLLFFQRSMFDSLVKITWWQIGKGQKEIIQYFQIKILKEANRLVLQCQTGGKHKAFIICLSLRHQMIKEAHQLVAIIIQAL